MRFEFATAARIVFGAGTAAELPALTREFGAPAFIVTGGSPERVSALTGKLPGARIVSFSAEPTIPAVEQAAQLARESQAKVVVAIGGGSALDAGKAIAALTANPGPALDYLEVIGKGNPLPHPALPFIAVPTTAGTGSEVTRNAVLSSPQHSVKVSLRSPHMLAKVALVDPELTLNLPLAWTAATGLDALTQLIEPFVSSRANPLTDALCLQAIPQAANALPRACEHPTDLEARTAMALASLYGGLALANAGLGAVHGFAAAIGGMFEAPHGAICAILLPHVMEENLRAGASVDRYTQVARLLTNNPSATAAQGVAWVANLVDQLAIPKLAAYGVTEAGFPAIAGAAAKASSMKANPVALSPETLHRILQQAL